MKSRLSIPETTWESESSLVARDEVGAVIAQASPDRIALMLYGSYARGTADGDSDIDVLELVTKSPRSYKLGKANVTQYVPAHLHALGQQGSLFVLHLRMDGKVVLDTQFVLRNALNSYTPPVSYEHLWNQLSTAAGILDPSAQNFEDYVHGLARLGIYILRTAVYLRSIELGRPNFDVESLSAADADRGLRCALALRRRDKFTLNDVVTLRHQIELVVPNVKSNELSTVEAYAVANSDRPDLSSLFSAVLSTSGQIEYSALTLPPF